MPVGGSVGDSGGWAVGVGVAVVVGAERAAEDSGYGRLFVGDECEEGWRAEGRDCEDRGCGGR